MWFGWECRHAWTQQTFMECYKKPVGKTYTVGFCSTACKVTNNIDSSCHLFYTEQIHGNIITNDTEPDLAEWCGLENWEIVYREAEHNLTNTCNLSYLGINTSHSINRSSYI